MGVFARIVVVRWPRPRDVLINNNSSSAARQAHRHQPVPPLIYASPARLDESPPAPCYQLRASCTHRSILVLSSTFIEPL
ncbi:hypothetical protein Micbo1qcDRAFT_165154, partial [Microdochium bolleyi]